VHLRELPGHLCVGRNGSAVIVGGEVKGSTDFIYGFGISYFENTTLASRGVSGGLVAWKGYTEFYGPDTFGAYFNNTTIIESSHAKASLNSTRKRALARPWNDQSRLAVEQPVSCGVHQYGHDGHRQPARIHNLAGFGSPSIPEPHFLHRGRLVWTRMESVGAKLLDRERHLGPVGSGAVLAQPCLRRVPDMGG